MKLAQAAASFSRTSIPPVVRLSETATAPFQIRMESAHTPDVAFDVLSAESVRERVLEELRRLFELAKGWDGEGGAAPSQVTIDAASAFFVDLEEAGRADEINVPEPKIIAAGDGSVGFVWRHPAGLWTLEVEIDESSISFVGSALGRVFQGVPQSPEDILRVLRAQ